MSFIAIPDGIANFSKATISLWFRVPKESLDAAVAQPVPDDMEHDFNRYFPALQNVIPLITFGSLEYATTDLGYGSGAYPVAPSFVGVDCSHTRFPIFNTLCVHLSMSTNSTFEMTPMGSDGPPLDQPQFIDGLPRKDAFYMSGNGQRPYYDTEQSQLEVTADKWHHALISFDLTIPAVVDYSTDPLGAGQTVPLGGPTFMWAFDDVDKTDFSLAPSSAQMYNVKPPGSAATPTVPAKQITMNNLIRVGGGSNAFVGTWTPVDVQSWANPVGIPAGELFVANIYPVEMAELQFFSGITIDTSVEEMRRLFVDDDGKPVLPSAAEERLGQKPEILLHGSGNWIRGHNTGGGIDPPQFTPTGKITAYSGPRLGT